MSASVEMLEARDTLVSLGHTVVLPENVEAHAIPGNGIENKQEKIELDAIQVHYEAIKDADAILVLNKEKRGFPGYVGGNTLMEMGFAYVLDKKIFMMYEIPNMSYTDEIEAVQPILLNGDLTAL